jgi:uracil-DNA glycosylase
MDLQELGQWADILSPDPEYWNGLSDRVETAYETTTVYPPREKLFAALQATPPSEVRVVILGQDPYHQPGQAHGLSFSVEPGTPIPKSLGNIYRELQSDLGLPIPTTGCLRPWTGQGVLLLNAVLTVAEGKAGSHRAFGWETFTDSIIQATNALPQPIAFVLWGNFAIKKAPLIAAEAPRLILTAPHPSPLSAYRGFFGSRPFSQINDFLRSHGEPEIDWRL